MTCTVNWRREGRELTSVMFDPERCGKEILKAFTATFFMGELRPEEFDPQQFLGSIQKEHSKILTMDMAVAR